MTIIIILLIVIAYLLLTGNSAREKTQREILEKLDEQNQKEKKQGEELCFRLGKMPGDEDDNFDVTVLPSQRWYSFMQVFDIYHWDYTFQYKFDENKSVLVKLMFLTDNGIRVVQDGVIIEEEFKKAYQEDRGNYDREILTKQVTWHKCEPYSLRTLLLSLHPEVISHSDLRQQIRQELETFKGQCQKLNEHAAQIGAQLAEEDGYLCLKLSGESREDEQKLVDLCKQFNLNFHNFVKQKNHIKELEESLTRIPPKPLYDD